VLIGLSENEMVGYVTYVGNRWDAYRVLAGKRMGKKPLGTLRHKWGIILKWIFKKLVVGMDWIDLPQGTDIWQAVVNATMNIWIS
jgi:hypothetical protein